MIDKLNEIIERLDRIEQSLNLMFSVEKGREQMRKGEYVPSPFEYEIDGGGNFVQQCTCGTSARCYRCFPVGTMRDN